MVRALGVVAIAASVAACGRLEINPRPDGPLADALSTSNRRWVDVRRSAPGALRGPRAVFHTRLGQVVMYGGDRNVGSLPVEPSAAMWAYDGSTWISLCDPCAPTPLFAPGLAYDSKRHQILLYGGLGVTAAADRLWAWDAAQGWREIPTTGPTPGPRGMVQMVYDEVRDRVVLFGGAPGADPSVYDNSVFEFDFERAQWSRPAITGDQPARLGGTSQTAAWNAATSQIEILEDHAEQADSDSMWAWNGTWRKLCDGCTGLARRSAALVVDVSPPQTLVIGGYRNDARVEIAGTWVRDASGSRMLSSDPTPRDSMAVAHDAKRDVFVLYGGNGDCRGSDGNCDETWELVRD